MDKEQLIGIVCLALATLIAVYLIWDTCVKSSRPLPMVRLGAPATYRRQKGMPLIEKIMSHVVSAWIVAACVTATLLTATAWTF